MNCLVVWLMLWEVKMLMGDRVLECMEVSEMYMSRAGHFL